MVITNPGQYLLFIVLRPIFGATTENRFALVHPPMTIEHSPRPSSKHDLFFTLKPACQVLILTLATYPTPLPPLMGVIGHRSILGRTKEWRSLAHRRAKARSP